MIKQLEESRSFRRGLGATLAFLITAAMWVVSSQGAEAATVAIAAKGFAFTPEVVTVKVGDTVTWTNGDDQSHAVEGGSISSPEIRPGESFSKTFTAPEEISYICRFHTYMHGTIHVLAAGASTATTVPPAAAPTTTVAPSPSASTPTSAPVPTTAAPAPTAPTTPTVTRGPGFQDMPDDPSARQPPGTTASTSPVITAPPTSVAPPTTTPRSAPTFQAVPDDSSATEPPGTVHAQAASTGASPSATAAPIPTNVGTSLGDGTVLAPYDVKGGVKEFHLTMTQTTIQTLPGVVKPALAFNGVVPGPTLRVNEGDRIRVVVDNQANIETSVHWHGMILPNDQDGVGGITQPHIMPGQKYTYEFTAVATGTHWYHAHSSGRDIGKGLYGMLEVVPKQNDFKAAHDYSLMLGDTDLGFTINGRSFPNTPVLAAKTGEPVRLRVVNTGDQVHAFHLHGVPFEVLAQDGNPKQSVEKMDTLTIAPGQTFDLRFTEQYPGDWMLHCHMFVHSHMDTHPEGSSGMTGMALIVRVSGPPRPTTGRADSTIPGLPDRQLGAVSALGLGGLATSAVRRRRRTPLRPSI